MPRNKIDHDTRIKIIDFVTHKELDELRDFLSHRPDIIDQLSEVIDDDGKGLLELSIPSGSVEMTAFLLALESDILNISNCLLIAIKYKKKKMTIMILEKQKRLGIKFALDRPCKSQTRGLWRGVCDEYPPYITPLVLACLINSAEMVKILLEYGYRLQKPHSFNCNCPLCRGLSHPSLLEAKARYVQFKAISSPAYLIQTSFDPVLAAFRLNTELREEATNEPELHDEYMELAEQCVDLSTALLSLCRTTEEVLILLSRSAELSTNRKFQPFNRVQQALQLGFKRFVANMNCQQVLSKEWYGKDSTFRDLTSTATIIYFSWRVITLPLLGVFLWLFPCVERGRLARSHATMFLDQAASFSIFLFVNLARQIIDEEGPSRAPPIGFLSYYVIIHVTGCWYELSRKLLRKGNQAFLQDTWNLYDIIMLTLYNLTFYCWVATAYEVTSDPDSVNIPRPYWPAYEPKLMGEIMYSFCTLLTFFSCFKYLQVNRTIGPLQLCIRRMIMCITPFLAIMVIVWLAFSVTMTTLYRHYAGYKATMPDGSVVEQSDAYSNLLRATYSIYWSFFGFTDLDVPKVVLPQLHVKVGSNYTTIYHKHYLTESMGIILFGSFHLVGIVILMNIMIAMVTQTYSEIVSMSMVEWKVSRTKIWISSLYTGCRLPVPFNLLPSLNMAVDLYRCVKGCTGRSRKSTLNFWFYTKSFKTIGDDDVVYGRLMVELAGRYLKAGGAVNV